MNFIETALYVEYKSVLSLYYKQDETYTKLLQEIYINKNTQKKKLESSQRLTVETLYSAKESLLKNCIEEYSRQLLVSSNPKDIYINDIVFYTSNYYINMVEILILAGEKIRMLDNNILGYVLNQLINYFKLENVTRQDDWLAKNIFEHILDISENDIECYYDAIVNLFNLNKSIQWYQDFHQQIIKLIYKLTPNKLILDAVKKGLSIGVSDIQEDLIAYIKYNYINTKLTDDNLNWL